MRRPGKRQAEAAIDAFLKRQLGHVPEYKIIPDGDHNWAFWVRHQDDTSYLHHDLKIEWYGTSHSQEAMDEFVDEATRILSDSGMAAPEANDVALDLYWQANGSPAALQRLAARHAPQACHAGGPR